MNISTTITALLFGASREGAVEVSMDRGRGEARRTATNLGSIWLFW